MQNFLSVTDMRQWLAERARVLSDSETLPLLAACGRVLAADVVSTVNVPPHDNSAMDGYALAVADFAPGLAVSQRIPAGTVPQPHQPGSVARIFTGAPVPPGADAVVMQEQAEVAEDGSVTLTVPPKPGQNIRRAGEDIALGQVVVAAGQVLTPADLGLLASIGQATVSVRRQLRVAVFFTGDEARIR